jgi:hypothetical protein
MLKVSHATSSTSIPVNVIVYMKIWRIVAQDATVSKFAYARVVDSFPLLEEGINILDASC